MAELFDDRYRTKSLRLAERDYSQPGSYFITICTQWQKSYFGEVIDGNVKLNDIGNIVQDFWSQIPYHFENVELDVVLIMPNHIHGIVTIYEDSHTNECNIVNEVNHRRDNSWIILQQDISWNVSTNKNTFRRNMLLPKIIGKFKMQTAKQINQIKWIQWKFWQANYYEHVVRNERDLERIRTYIMNNPYKRRNDEYYR